MKRNLLFLVGIFILTSLYSQTIWKSDFSNPDDWYIKVYETSEAKWVIGETNTSIWMSTIKSSSGGNFALFNSNTEINEKQDALLMTNNLIPVKFGKEVHIKFQHYFKQWGDEYLYFYFYTYSDDSSHWEILNSDYYKNDSSTNPQTIDIDVTKYITEDDSVYFGFDYYSSSGNNYAWFIDDVAIYYPATDAEVTDIATLGELPLQYATPHKIKARISNTGSKNMSNISVNLSITGTNKFTNSKVISQLLPDSSVIIAFDDFKPAKLGNQLVTVSISNDDIPENNSKSFSQVVTLNTFNYADTSKPDDGIGITNGNGMYLSKFHINNAKTVKNIHVCFSDNTRSILKKVYAVLLDKNGKLIAKSDEYTIQSEDLMKYHAFALNSYPLLENTDLYAGLALIEAGDVYYPLGIQEQDVYPIEPYYWAGDLVPTEVKVGSYNNKLMIRAELGDPTPTICLITNDMKTGNNLIVWERFNSGSVEKYNIYREGSIAKRYDLIGEVPYTSLSVFEDKTALNLRRQYSYKISAVDTMGNESEYSPYNKTLLLQFGGGLDAGVVNINWQKYEAEDKELQFASYNIYRSVRDDSVNLVKIDSIPGDQMAYKDFNANALKYRTYYRIAGLMADTCFPSILKQLSPPFKKAGGGGYVEAISNMEDNRLRDTWESVDYESMYRFAFYPNPYSRATSMYYYLPESENVEVTVSDIMGKKISVLYSGLQNAGNHQVSLNTSEIRNMPNGLYILQFRNSSSVISRQFVKIQ